jgi:hypothetical protein
LVFWSQYCTMMDPATISVGMVMAHEYPAVSKATMTRVDVTRNN